MRDTQWPRAWLMARDGRGKLRDHVMWREMRPSYASLCSVSNFFFSGNVTNFPAALQPSSTCRWFRLLTVCCQRLTNQPIVFCVVRPTLNSLALAKRAVSLFSSRAATLVSHVSRLRCSRARALLSLNLKKKRDCSQSTQWENLHIPNNWTGLFWNPAHINTGNPLQGNNIEYTITYHKSSIKPSPSPSLQWGFLFRGRKLISPALSIKPPLPSPNYSPLLNDRLY